MACQGDTAQTTVREVIERALRPRNLNVVSVQHHGLEGYIDIQKPLEPDKLNSVPNFPTVWLVRTSGEHLKIPFDRILIVMLQRMHCIK